MSLSQSNRLANLKAEHFVVSRVFLNATRIVGLFIILLLSLLVCIPSQSHSNRTVSSPALPLQGHDVQRTARPAQKLSPPALLPASVSTSVGDVAVDVGGNTIKKLNGADGTVLWSAPISGVGFNEGALAVDQLDLGVYTGNGSHIIGGTSTVYKYTASGALAWTDTISRSGTCNFYRVTAAAVDTSSSIPGVVWTQTGCYGGIAKSDRSTGAQLWSVYTLDIGRPSIDPSNGDIYANTTQSWNQIYKATTTGSLTSAASCTGYTDLNPADGMLYRGGGGCGLNLSQLDKSNLAVPNWTMAIPGITSFDTLAVQPWSGGYVYVGSVASSKIVVVDPATQTVVTSFTTVPLGNIAVNPAGGNIYIASGNFVYAYSPTGTLVWTSPNQGGPVYNVAAPMGIVGTASTLGNYPDTTVALGANATVTPDAAPTDTTSINVSSSTNFKGRFSADPATGVVRVTNAHPAGTYAVTVTAFNGSVVNTTKTFTLTVQTGTACTGISIFTNAADASVGSGPQSVAIGDFNGDGNQDLATANYSSNNNVSILLGTGTGSFGAATNFGVGSYPFSVAVGDFNGDGKQDLAVANSDSSNVSILLGTGTGSFGAATNFAAGSGAVSVVVGDFNGDGNQDLATANTTSDSSHFVYVLLGTGTGSFGAATDFAVGYRPSSVAVGDFNGDGKHDLAVANESFASMSVSILLGTGTGNFGAATNFGVGGDPVSVAVGDFNGDGQQDLVTANYWTRNLSILLGTGTGSFGAATDLGVGAYPNSLAVGDFNGDGQQDLATAKPGSNYVSILLGTGTGSFGAATDLAVGSGPNSVAVGDFNGDGRQDLAAANNGSNNVSIRLGACSLPPTIAATTGLSRQQGSPATNSQIATVTDDGGDDSVSVTVTSANPSNGVSVSNIFNTGGNITADIVADCTATNAAFTLQASDGSSTAVDTLSLTVTANTAPTLTYASPQAVIFGGSLNLSPTSASDNGTITSYVVQAGHGLTTAPTVDASGLVSITNAQPAGAHTITIRATDNCGATTDVAFTLNVGAAPTFAIDDVTHNEGNAGTTSYTFTVTRAGSTAINSSVNFQTQDGTATTANNDYQAQSGTLTFLPVDTTKTITVLVNGDTTFEANETFTVHLSAASGATISGADGTGTITNDDVAPIVVSLPSKQDPPGGPSIIPITVGDTTGQGIGAYDFDISFDPSVLQPQATPFDATGTMSGGWSINSNTATPGHLILNAFGTSDLSGQGVLLNLKFNVIGGGGSTSPLTWEIFTFNEGTPVDTDVNGVFTVMPAISGHLNYQDSIIGARNVTMTLTGTGGFVTRTTTTDVNGDYTFAGVPVGNNYVVTPSRTAEVHDLSITAFDASQAARFAALLITLSPNKQTAGDSSNNGAVTAFDASQIARYQLQIASPGSIAGSWKFTPASLTIDNLTADQTNQNLTAILVGDISGNWTPSGPAGLASSLPAVNMPVSLPVKQDPPGGTSILSIAVGDTTGQMIAAYAFDISFDPTVLQPQATPYDATGTLSNGWAITPNTLIPGHLILNAFGTSDLSGQGVLLNLKFNVVGAPGSTTPLTWVNFTFNEGTPGDTDINGSFTTAAPSAAEAGISGRIIDVNGQPVAGTTVTVMGDATIVRAITDRDGFYRVEALEASGFYTVTPNRANYVFAPANRSFSLVGNRTDAMFTGTLTAPAGNPLESPEFFVRQQYLDFLGREPEQGGLDYWSGQLRACGNDGECLQTHRLEVSAAFFIAQEFQESGLYIYDMYEGGLGRRPDHAEYTLDHRMVEGGPQLEADKASFATSFVAGTEFITRYPLTMSDEVFVDALLRTAQQSSGLDFSRSRADLIAIYNSGSSLTESRSLVLRSVVESTRFKQTQYNAAFVLMEYYGYLMRNPDRDGYDFWLNVLNTGERNNYRGMVCSFITSAEYQRRFSSIVTRSNSECGR